MNPLLKGLEHLGHAAVRMAGERTIYVDPFQIERNYLDADVIFITHSHHDHFSPEDIRRVKKAETVLVLPSDCEFLAAELGWHNTMTATVGMTEVAAGVSFTAVPAYNVGKSFHAKNRCWLGYIILFNGNRIYVAGDTDVIPEMAQHACDVAFLPVGGTYTMTAVEAVEAVRLIKPKVAVPTHYGAVIGSQLDAQTFLSHLPAGVEGALLHP